LTSYLESQGQAVKKGTEKNKDALVAQVKSNWYETEDQAEEAYTNVKEWIFASWTDSQIKAFLDKYDIPNPNPRTRDTLLATARANYHVAAKKAGETASYPGDWLYKTWSDSELKVWLDERGYPVPQPSTRDKFIATIRRNSHLASQSLLQAQSSASSSAAAAKQTLADALLDSWSDSQIKEWCDKNNIKVPQGSTRNDLIALARKHRAQLTGDTVGDNAAKAYGAASSNAGNEYAQATEAVWDAVDWARAKLGLMDDEASSSYSSAASVASKSTESAKSSASSATKRAKSEL